MSISIIIFISNFIYLSISIIIFSLVVKYAAGEKPEPIGSVLKLSIVYERYSWQPESQISTTKGANWIYQRRHSLGRGRSQSQFFSLGLKGSAKLKMLGW